MKKTKRRLSAIILAFAVAFTMMPAMSGTLDAHAAAGITGFKAYAAGTSNANIYWTKLAKKQQKKVTGITVFRNGSAVMNLSKKSASFADSGLAPGTSYSYQVKTYKATTTKVKMWKNKKTGQLQKKAPSKKQKKNFKKVTIKQTKYKYRSASPVKWITTGAVTTTPGTGGSSSGGSSSGGSSGGSDSGSSTQPTPMTAYNCVDYLGESHSFWKGADGKYYTSQSGGTIVSNLAMYDKTVDGSWTSQNNASSRRNGRFYQKNGTTLKDNGTGILIFNGNTSKAKVEIEENTGTFKHGIRTSATGAITYKDINCVMIGEDRLVTFEYGVGDLYGVDYCYVDFGTSGDYAAESYGFDGYIDGTVHVNKYYDFNNDGSWSADEKVFGTGEENIKKSPRSVKALEIAQAAVNDAKNHPEDYAEILNLSLSDYWKDLKIIKKYLLNHYNYYTDSDIDGSGLNAQCTGGANILRIWSAYKYHVYGFVDCAPGGSGHVAFYPGIDGVQKGVISNEYDYVEANGDMTKP